MSVKSEHSDVLPPAPSVADLSGLMENLSDSERRSILRVMHRDQVLRSASVSSVTDEEDR